MLHHLEKNIDYDLILKEALDEKGYVSFVLHEPYWYCDGFQIKKMYTGYAKQISNYYASLLGSNACSPRFYFQKKNFKLPYHKDLSTLCSINYVLSNPLEKIKFMEGKYNDSTYYDTDEFGNTDYNYCLNYMLSNDEGIKETEISYQCALVDVQKEHAVTNLSEDRRLLKISIFDKTYDEVLNILLKKNLGFINPK